jgi:hypothetical protein
MINIIWEVIIMVLEEERIKILRIPVANYKGAESMRRKGEQDEEII